MNFQDLAIPLASSLLGGLIVAVANHWMTRRRERDKKLSDLRIEHLITCWKQIERAANVGDINTPIETKNQRYDELEAAIASIMLLGDKREVEVAKKFAIELSDGSDASVTELLNSLRQSLRRELKLEPVDGLGLFFRMHRDWK